MVKSLFDLGGKVALVTGSTRGIGKSIAEELARAGARVVVSSRKAEACEAVRAEFEKQGFAVLAQPCNVSPLTAIPDEAFDKVFLNNVKSVLWLAAITLPGMAERGGGSLITVGSIGGIAVFLASDAAAFITGQVIVADGGVTIL